MDGDSWDVMVVIVAVADVGDGAVAELEVLSSCVEEITGNVFEVLSEEAVLEADTVELLSEDSKLDAGEVGSVVGLAASLGEEIDNEPVIAVVESVSLWLVPGAAEVAVTSTVVNAVVAIWLAVVVDALIGDGSGESGSHCCTATQVTITSLTVT